MRIFADTSGLFASLVRNDLAHQPARGVMERLIVDGAEIRITNYVLIETTALLQSRVGLEAALLFERTITPMLTIVWVREALHRRAFRRLEQIGSRSVSLVDCCSVVAMEDAGIERIFAFDPHFGEQGFQVINDPEHLDQIE